MSGAFSGSFSGAFSVSSPSPPASLGPIMSARPTPSVDAIVTIPTAINTCLIAAENITDNLRAQQPSDLELPSLYKRAFLVAYVTDEVALVRR